jgi:hypothetical protein
VFFDVSGATRGQTSAYRDGKHRPPRHRRPDQRRRPAGGGQELQRHPRGTSPTARLVVQALSLTNRYRWCCYFLAAPRRRATSHLEQPPERLDNEAVASAKSTSDANQKPAPLRKSQSGVATLGRLRVVTPAQVQGGGSLVESPATPEQERPRRRQPSAARSSRSGLRDQSLTQFAVIDDENVSQQVTRGGALTLASQWKSQFDDSEETTDNEWKPESPEHRATLVPNEGAAPGAPPPLSRISEDSRTSHKKYINIAGIEDYPELMGEYGGFSKSFKTVTSNGRRKKERRKKEVATNNNHHHQQ